MIHLKINKNTKVISESRSTKPYPDEVGFLSVSREDVPSCCAGGKMDGDTFTPALKPVAKIDPKVEALKAIDASTISDPNLKAVIEFLQN